MTRAHPLLVDHVWFVYVCVWGLCTWPYASQCMSSNIYVGQVDSGTSQCSCTLCLLSSARGAHPPRSASALLLEFNPQLARLHPHLPSHPFQPHEHMILVGGGHSATRRRAGGQPLANPHQPLPTKTTGMTSRQVPATAAASATQRPLTFSQTPLPHHTSTKGRTTTHRPHPTRVLQEGMRALGTTPRQQIHFSSTRLVNDMHAT